MLHLSTPDVQELLNHLGDIDIGDREKKEQGKADASAMIYRRSQRQHVLRGFGCVDKAYPENSTDISPLKLEELTGLSITALTPKQRSSYWALAGATLVTAELVLGSLFNIDPVFTVLPASLFLLGLDQIAYKGAFFETFYQTLFPEYKKKVICHEAGHFLIAYLLGLPVSACVTSAWEARKYPEIRGQAGTVFTDTKLNEELAAQRLTRASIDRLSVVLMAGIAAEALQFGNAEGGIVDEQELFGLLTQVQPPWNLLRIQGQARWAAVQALLLIREHRDSFDALYESLCAGRPVGDCVLAIEQHLPAQLPSLQRSEARKQSLKESERNSLLRYIQRLTYKVGGIEKAPVPLSNITKEGYLIRSSLAPTLSSTSEVSGSRHSSTTTAEPSKAPSTLQKFAESIKLLEEATLSGHVNITDKEVSAGGGIWLNGLRTYADGKTRFPPTAPALGDHSSDDIAVAEPITYASPRDIVDSSPSESMNNADMFSFPRPIPGYEERLKLLVSSTAEDKNSTSRSQSLLQNHRGFQVKRFENQLAHIEQQLTSINQRLSQLQQ